jgi:flagellum-specific ATP synthase
VSAAAGPEQQAPRAQMRAQMREQMRAQMREQMREWTAPEPLGRVREVTGTVIHVEMRGISLGDILEIERPADRLVVGRRSGTPAGDASASARLVAQVVGFRHDVVLAIPMGPLGRVAPHAAVRRLPARTSVPVGEQLIGRVIDPFGHPLDGGAPPVCADRVQLDAPALPVAERAEVALRFDTGVRAIDGLLTCGRGQRIGVFAGAGCGKSMLVEQIAGHAPADVVVVGLVGERGREVRELMGAARRGEMIIVAATADRSPLERVRCAWAATAIAEWFRDRRQNVLLVIDSLTRYAMALRELGVAVGEPPATKGYPPSVFATLPRLLERVAPREGGGAITGFYTVLVEGDDLEDPIADAARALLDAHIMLSRELASRGHFPAIDLLASASRVARRVAAPELTALATRSREVLSRRKQALELQALGAYVAGANPMFDRALVLGEQLDVWACQPPEQAATYEETVVGLAAALGEAVPTAGWHGEGTR